MIHAPRRVKTPVILQMEAAECGATALAIVLGYYGLFLPLEKIREDCGVSRDGSKAISMIKAARMYGMDAQGFSREPDTLQELPMPVILHWNSNHFVVLEGIVGDRVFINDPEEGRLTITKDDLNEAFTGIVLSLHPGKDFRPSGSRTTIGSMLIPKIRPEIIPLSFLFLAGIAMLIPGIALPLASQVFIDQVILANHESLLYPLMVFMTFFVILQVLISWVRHLCLARWGTDLSFRLTRSFFYKVLFLPLRFFDQRYAGEISARVGLNDDVAYIISEEGATVILDIIIALVYLILLFSLSLPLTLIACAIALLNFIFLIWMSQKQVDVSRKVILEHGKLSGVSCAGIQMIESLKSGAQESEFFERWAGSHAQYTNSLRTERMTSLLMSIFPTLITGIGITSTLAVGSLQIMSGAMTIGMFFAFQALLINFLMPFQRLLGIGELLLQLEGSLQRLADVEKNVPKKSTTAVTATTGRSDGMARKLKGHLHLDTVTFGYNPLEPPLIDGLSLNLPMGSRTALVGSSGCGKTTIARLTAGLYQPWSGEIRIDGEKIADIPGQRRYLSVAFVSQDFFTFEGTIRENISLWDKTLPEEEIIRAAQDAGIDTLIESLPGGYSHMITEGGRNLSGGERQRLEIARALAVNPTLLILDEATSALDPDTEKRIENNIRQRGCTCLVIAHRLSTVRDCDQIIVLDRGSIVEQGTHESLMHNQGLYYHLITAESGKPEGIAS